MPLEIQLPTDIGGAPTGDLVIGLINNMPDAALSGTESQFSGLLTAAAGGRHVLLRYYSLPEVARGKDARASIAARYWRLDDLFRDPPDGLIVTGTEPKTPNLSDEPYWPRLVQVIEFARARTISSAWSCLAAHAAVLCLDGIERRRLAHKRFGVFDQDLLTAAHPLTLGLGPRLRTPHSRWNDAPLDALTRAGYRILSASAAGEADMFCKEERSLMVFFQGHPEYEERTLLKEYQRDVGRYIGGEYADFPQTPPGYFSGRADALIAEFKRALGGGGLREPLAAFPFLELAESIDAGWLGEAARIYRNWLELIASRKFASRSGPAGANCGLPHN